MELQKKSLTTKTKLCDDLSISFYLILLQGIEKSATLANHLQQPSSGVMVLLVCFEVIGQVGNPLAQNSDLNFGRTRVRVVVAELTDQLGLSISGQCHALLALNLLKHGHFYA